MTTENTSTDEAKIRGLIEDRVKAVATKDLDAGMANHDPEVVMFDVVNPLRYSGTDAVRERTKAWFSLYDGAIGYEVRDLDVKVGGDAAFCHYLYRVSGTKTDGLKVEMWVRATLCFRKSAGEWVLAHEHDSVPFDPDSGRASLDLEPD
jgi:uncharacterized protein (TIGR02246 family)